MNDKLSKAYQLFSPTKNLNYGLINDIARYAIYNGSDTNPVREPRYWFDHLVDNEVGTLMDVLCGEH